MTKLKAIQASYDAARDMELNALKIALQAFGGEAHFGHDYTGEGATGTDCPIVVCNLNGFYGHAADVKIISIKCQKKKFGGTDFTIYGQEICHGGAADYVDEETSIPIDSICLGELKWIIEAIPEIEAVPETGLFMLYGENACGWYAEEGIDSLIKHIDEDIWDAHAYDYSAEERAAYIQGIEDSDGFGNYCSMSAEDYHRLMRHTGNEQS